MTRGELKYKLQQRAKDLHIKTHVDEQIRAVEKKIHDDEVNQRKEQQSVEGITNFEADSSGKSYENLYCGSWIATEDGIQSQESSRANQTACYHPILPVRRMRNMQTGEEQITIAFKRGRGLWSEITVAKDMVANARAIVNLAKYGIGVTSETAKLLVRYMSDVENFNDDRIALVQSSSKLGWHNDSKEFLPYDKTIVFDAELRFPQIIRAISEYGSYAVWLEHVKKIRSDRFIEPRIALAASFSSVIVKFLNIASVIVDFNGSTEAGKAQPLDTKIITPYGYKLMGDVCIGDFVTGGDGKPHRVIGVFPQGKKEIYEITFKDGTKTRCCKDHLWKVNTLKRHAKNRGYMVMSLEEMLKKPIKEKSGFTYKIPICNPVEYDLHPELKIDPYMLGLLIGDGCLTLSKGCLYFSNTEDDILEYMKNISLKYNGTFKKCKATNCQYIIVGAHPLKQAIKEYGLNVKSGSRFIPNDYFFGSVEERKSLLSGLFDTDGNVCTKTGSFKYSTTSEKLAKDVCVLCRSLGYRAKIGNNKRDEKSEEFTVTIYTDDYIFRSKKHIERAKLHKGNRVFDKKSMIIVDVQKAGEEECQCIMLDSQEHTYLCDDFIVTHNTVMLMLAASVWACPDEGQYIGDFLTTDTELEVRADMLNNLPLILDDTAKMRKNIKDNIEQVIYNLSSGSGKKRSNKDLSSERVRTWKNSVIVNGERPLNSFVEQGGAINRIIEVGLEGEQLFDSPIDTAEIIRNNYGFAGKIFVESIKNMELSEIRKLHKKYSDLLKTKNTMQKQVLSMAAILTADDLATKIIFHDSKNLTAKEVSCFLTDKSMVTDGPRCYEYLMGIISEKGQHFDLRYDNLDQWGEIENILPAFDGQPTEQYVNFYVNSFCNLLKDAGYSRRAFTSWAKREGLLRWNTSNDRDVYGVRQSNGPQKRFISVKIVADLDEYQAQKHMFD